MKSPFKKNFPELHINPIHRDLFMVMMLGLAAALAVSTIAAMMISRW